MQSFSSPDAEKHAQDLESVTTRPSNEIQQLPKNSTEGLMATSESIIKRTDKPQQENENPKANILPADEEFKTLTHDRNTMEGSVSVEIKQLLEDNQTSAQQAQELSTKLAALQARSPGVRWPLSIKMTLICRNKKGEISLHWQVTKQELIKSTITQMCCGIHNSANLLSNP